jgi:hypothetical protein
MELYKKEERKMKDKKQKYPQEEFELCRRAFEIIYEDIKEVGKSYICPGWSCNICQNVFPRIVGVGCPCTIYSRHYLLRKLKEMLSK